MGARLLQKIMVVISPINDFLVKNLMAIDPVEQLRSVAQNLSVPQLRRMKQVIDHELDQAMWESRSRSAAWRGVGLTVASTPP